MAAIIHPGEGYAVKTMAIGARTIATFSHLFYDASNVSWVKIGNKALARFTSRNKETKALFDKKGRLVYTITYGKEADLPTDTRMQIKRNYVELSITMAIEIKEEGRTIWVVQLEDSGNLVLVRSENGDFEEMNHYKKSH